MFISARLKKSSTILQLQQALIVYTDKKEEYLR